MDNPFYEAGIRIACFAGVLLAMALGEILAPRRKLTANKPLRWLNNLGLTCLNTLAARLLLPTGAVGMALLAETNGWGLLNNLEIPGWVGVILAVVLLDFVVYLQHVLFHAVPVLWRLHMPHHADLDFDVTTGVRFHPIEILLSLGIKLAVVSLLGASPLAVLVFEILLNATALFNHSNVRLPSWLDAVLRLFVVTPDMHRVHHSANPQETNRNFGFNLPWWDFLFGTYRAQPEKGHEEMVIGLLEFRDEKVTERLPSMLALPFMAKPAGDAASSP